MKNVFVLNMQNNERRYSKIIEEGEYCHHFSLVTLCFKKYEGKFLLPGTCRQWTKVVSLDTRTFRSDPNFYEWKCYDYIPFIVLSLSLLKIFHDPDFVLQILLVSLSLVFEVLHFIPEKY